MIEAKRGGKEGGKREGKEGGKGGAVGGRDERRVNSALGSNRKKSDKVAPSTDLLKHVELQLFRLGFLSEKVFAERTEAKSYNFYAP